MRALPASLAIAASLALAACGAPPPPAAAPAASPSASAPPASSAPAAVASTSASATRVVPEPSELQLTCIDGALAPYDPTPISPDEPFGAGGLGLSGIGDGSGSSEGIGLGGIGTVGDPGVGTAPARPRRRGAVVGAPNGVKGARARALAEGGCGVASKVRACFDVARKASPALAGTMTVSLDVDAKGVVTAAKSAVVAPLDAAFGACVEKAFAGASFPAAASGSASYALTFEPPRPKLLDAGSEVQGRLPPEVIKRIVRQNFPRVRECYEKGLKKKPDLAGTVSVAFVIDEKGAVTGATRAGGTLKDDDVAACVVKVFSTLYFPEPEGGKVKVTYPIDLRTE